MSDNKQRSKPSAAPLKASGRHAKGPEPERLKIEGYANWQDAAAVVARAKKPPGGWPKR